MIIDLPSRALAIAEEERTAAYPVARKLSVELAPSSVPSRGRRSVVELKKHQAGIPRVVVGGVFEPGGDKLIVEIGVMDQPGRRRTCRAALGRRLVPGLPDEFAEPVLRGLAQTLAVGPGVVSIDRFGFDRVETSPLVAKLAAEVLGRVFSEELAVSESRARAWLEDLP